MIFKPEMVEAILGGYKTVTRRAVSDNAASPYHPSRIGYMIGAERAVCPGRGKAAICRVRVRSVQRECMDPSMLLVDEVLREGFVTRSGFMGAWAEIHGNLDQCDVWRIQFRLVHRPRRTMASIASGRRRAAA